MHQSCWAFPILPGRHDLARRFMRTLTEERQSDFAHAGERLGLTRVQWFLTDGVGGEQLVVCLEGADVDSAFELLIRSRDPFDLWLKARLADTTGLDLNDPPEGTRRPELLASFTAGAPPR